MDVFDRLIIGARDRLQFLRDNLRNARHARQFHDDFSAVFRTNRQIAFDVARLNFSVFVRNRKETDFPHIGPVQSVEQSKSGQFVDCIKVVEIIQAHVFGGSGTVGGARKRHIQSGKRLVADIRQKDVVMVSVTAVKEHLTAGQTLAVGARFAVPVGVVDVAGRVYEQPRPVRRRRNVRDPVIFQVFLVLFRRGITNRLTGMKFHGVFARCLLYGARRGAGVQTRVNFHLVSRGECRINGSPILQRRGRKAQSLAVK